MSTFDHFPYIKFFTLATVATLQPCGNEVTRVTTIGGFDLKMSEKTLLLAKP